ncbi:DUF4260 domain-containing protein [Pelagibacterium montanilacus]|uniref:DUF4260 domain-containing protein n=1 Tax=Pelagibacterium montanilacus TaxID=2185280 RepID=UPI000F8D2CA8|nr:DUF4260 domain-containing protein [Pelagibacterium montanilacus]
MTSPITWQRIEGLIIFCTGLALSWLWNEGMAWWAALLFFFAPDLGFLGYLKGPKVGAFVYNAVHIYGLGAGLLALGHLVSAPLLVALGTLWLAHAGFDRALGYGLKTTEGFSFTHLGRIGRRR